MPTPGQGTGGATAREPEPDLIPLSALQHYLFCPRQCALIHVEQLWSENRFTAEGRLLHEATAQAGTEQRRGVRTITAMPIASRALRVSGIADVVEMHKDAAGRWRPFPVEYKRGKPKAHRADEVQLCAQAMALEEMFAAELTEGALFYGATRRRVGVALDQELRALTARVADEARAMIAAGATPPAVYEKRKCGACSLVDLCRPRQLSGPRSAAAWLSRCIAES
ncbi:MAG: CRISPR-associated protein Cas4 [Hyphomonadaceae bacterium]|nr:CRISPR-associated protein Cas4 [Hyphomonadaceae bacterium]